MKQTLLLMVLALGMCSINTSAQTKKTVRNTTTKAKATPLNSREYQVEDDGFEWYLVCKNGKYGAEDRSGNILIPNEYTKIWYIHINSEPAFFMAFMGDYLGAYLPNGKCIIPVSRKYNSIWGHENDKFGSYYTYNKKNGFYGICDINGKQLFEAPYDKIEPQYSNGKFFYEVYKKVNGEDKYGIIDGNGNIVIPLQKRKVYEISGDIYEITEELKGVIIGSTASINTTQNIFSANKGVIHTSSSSSSSSDNDSGGGKTTIVVEHQHTPQPMTEWVPCGACGHNPGVCQTCVGMGESASGRRCISCHGTGKCHFCNGQGGRYQTVYR